MLALVDLEEQVPKDHPLRTIKVVAAEALERLSAEFDGCTRRWAYTHRGPYDERPDHSRASYRVIVNAVRTAASAAQRRQEVVYNFAGRTVKGGATVCGKTGALAFANTLVPVNSPSGGTAPDIEKDELAQSRPVPHLGTSRCYGKDGTSSGQSQRHVMGNCKDDLGFRRERRPVTTRCSESLPGA